MIPVLGVGGGVLTSTCSFVGTPLHLWLVHIEFVFFFSQDTEMRGVRAGDRDFAWGSELDGSDDQEGQLDDDGNVLEDEEEDVSSFELVNDGKEDDVVEVGEEYAPTIGEEGDEEEGENEEDEEEAGQPPLFEDDGWVERPIQRGDAVPNERERPKTSFTAGMPIGMQGLTTPSDFVLRFLSKRFFHELWGLSKKHQLEDNTHRRDKDASPIELREIYVFFGILDAMSVRGSRLAKYDFWSADSILACAPIKEAMTFRRFSLIKRHLKMAVCANLSAEERRERDAEDSLWRVRLVLTEMENQNGGAFDPNGVKTLDEQIIQMYQKRVPLGLTSMFPNKPIGRGVRVESLNDRSGFTMCALLSQDKKRVAEILQRYPDIKEELSPSRQKFFACIMQGIGHKSFQRREYMLVVMDNLFIHPDLAICLYKYGVTVVGTWRQNFGVPKTLVKAKVTRENPYFAMEKKFVVQKGRSDVEGVMIGVKIRGHGSKSKGFYMFTTCPDLGLKEVLAKVPFGNGEAVPILNINDLYNRGKIGTDVEDQMRASYSIEMRPRRWHLAVLYWAYREQTVQGYICHRKLFPQKKMAHKEFLLQHSRYFMGGGPAAADVFRDEPQGGKRSGSTTPTTPRTTKTLKKAVNSLPRGQTGHFQGRGPQRQCVHCSDNKIRRRTIWCCTFCQYAAVCTECFDTVHTRIE